jgi:signal-transduction protein with cAMP-binding, CBS, and nucleotidyltransferase domain
MKEEKRVRDLMVPLDKYGLVSQNATLLEAVTVLQEAQKRRERGRQPFRAVLVTDENDKVIGKLGELAFLKALEPKHNVMADIEKLSSAGVSDQILSTVINHYNFFQDEFSSLCLRAKDIKVRDVMHTVSESIDENALLCEAIIKVIMWNTLSVLVTRNGEIVGLLRISDICQEVAEQMKALSGGDND